MSPVTQCDNCRAIGPAPPPPHWLALVRIGESSASFAQVIMGTGGPEMAGTFCGWQCVAEYASVRALAQEVEEGL